MRLTRDEQEHGLLPAAEAAGRGDQHQHQRGHRHGDVGADAEVLQPEPDADELRDDRQEVEHEEVTDAEPAPEPAEPLVDEPRVPDARHGPEPDHHLLVDDQDRDQQEQRPQQAVAVVLSRLGVGGHAAGVVVAHHHDQAGPDDREERQQTPAQATALRVVEPDPAERAFDVAEVRLVEDGTRPAPGRLRAAVPATWLPPAGSGVLGPAASGIRSPGRSPLVAGALDVDVPGLPAPAVPVAPAGFRSALPLAAGPRSCGAASRSPAMCLPGHCVFPVIQASP